MFTTRLLPALLLSSSAFAQLLSSIHISPTNLGPGETGTVKVTLSEPVEAAGLAIGASISSQNATSPATVAAPAGSTEITFPVTAANRLIKNEIVTVTVSLGTISLKALLALNKPAAPVYPVSIRLQQGVDAYSGCVDRVLGGGGQYAVKDPVFAPLRYGGDLKGWYLLWCDLSTIPAGSTIHSATLDLRATVFAGGPVNVQRLTDPDQLGGEFPQGWGTRGQAAAVTLNDGATPAFRNQTGSGTGIKWQHADPSDNHSHLAGILAPVESSVVYSNNGVYTHTITDAVRAWVNGAPNQGLAISAQQEDTQNIAIAPIHDENAGNHPVLSVTFTPNTSDLQPPATITDLTLVSCTSDSPIRCTLQWTAPGDDGMAGTAAAYEVLFSDSPAIDQDLTTARVAAVPPLPQPAGSTQTVTIENLGQGFPYYFVVRARDAAYNWAPPSNVVSTLTPNPRGILSGHPRILLNSSIPDTWTPGLDRLSAIRRRIQSGQAQAEFKSLRAIVNTLGDPFNLTDNAALLAPSAFAFLYQMLKPTDPAAANAYADSAIDKFLLKASWTDGGSDDTVAFQAEAAALIYDWCYERIAARGLRPQAIAALKNAYALLAADSYWQNNIRESDFHNYAVEIENAYIALGLALFGDDPSASGMLDRGWGMFAEGYPFQPTTFGDTFTFKLKQSIDDLTGGAMNWEGPVYWRAAAPEILRGIEAYDTATNREQSVWTNLFSNTVNGGYYKIYMLQPDGSNPGLGDATAGAATAGRDNFGMVILLDRFKDGYIKQFIDTAVRAPWDAGSGGALGLVWKLIFYDYTGQVENRPFKDLPTSREFGKDVVMRTGWGPNDTYVTFSAGYTGPYHNHLDQGSFTVFRQKPLIGTGGPYTTSQGPYYYSYLKRSVASDVPLIYDSTECWRDNTNSCSLANDGGQRWPWRRFNPPFGGAVFGINRLWSASVLADPATAASYSEQFNSARKYSSLNRASGTIDYISADLTKAYVNAYSNSASDPKNMNTNNRVSLVTRDLVFLKPGYIVIFDRVTATNAAFSKSLPLHVFSAPTIAGITAEPGAKGYAAGTIRSDNGNGRLFIQPVLPQNAQIRTVGGNTCRPVAIVSCTNANPAVCTTDQPHNLAEGETVGIQGGPLSGNNWATDYGINTDDGAVGGLTAHIVDNTSFTLLRLNGQAIDGTLLGPLPAGMQITYHANCGYEGYVDDYLGKPANLWWPANNNPLFDGLTPRWRAEVQPPPGSTADYFLNVLYPTTTSTASMPPTALIDVDNYYGVVIRATSPEVALFSKAAEPQTRLDYTADYDGNARHVVTGLRPGRYTITWNGRPLPGNADIAVEQGGLLNFTSPAGAFSIVGASRPGNR